MAERRRAFRRSTFALATGSALLALLVALPAPAQAAPYPPLPVRDGSQLLGNLTAPSLAPGASGTLGFSVANPLGSAIESVQVTLMLYAFNAFPGNATSTVPLAGAPTLAVAGASGASVNVTVPSIAPGSVYRGSVGIVTASSTPTGTFAVRTAVSFQLANGTSYRLESRGWFTTAAWDAATEEANGSVTLNLSRLGVSGVTPETAVLVSSSEWGWVLGSVLAAAVVLAGVAAWVYFRRGPGSSSGARKPPVDIQAPRALGKSRTSEGDSRKS